MGDVAMTSPVISAVARAYPDDDFSVLSTSFFEPFIDKTDNLHFIGTNIRKEKHGAQALWHLYRELAAQKFDIVVDLHDVLRTKILRFLLRMSGCRVYKIDKGRSEKRELTSHNSTKRRQLKSTIERYTDTFAMAGFDVELQRRFSPRCPIPEIDGIAQKGDEQWIGIAPFAQHRGKIYPIEKMESVVADLAQRGIRTFIFGGGPEEKRIAEEWAAKYAKCHSAIGKLKLEGEMALMSNMDCMVTMDSSSMHMASLYGVRVVSVWGATHPMAGFLGFQQSTDDAVQLNLPCRPCSIYGNKPCHFGDYRCLNIAPESIIERIFNTSEHERSY